MTRTYTNAEEVKAAYAEGERSFENVVLDGGDFVRSDLTGAQFFDGYLRGVVFDRAWMSDAHLMGCYLKEASFENAALDETFLHGSLLVDARLSGVNLSGATLIMTNLTRADLTHARLNDARFESAHTEAAQLDFAVLGGTLLLDIDASSFCEAEGLRHNGVSYIDPRTVMRTHHHPGLKRFMVDCGVPDIFAEYMIDCARALDEPVLRSLMQSTFISYGGPDEAFARRLYDALRRHGVVAFFFPEDARVGERIDNEVYTRIQEHDRVILVCSRASLDRPGVLNEVQETFDREARDGGATYLLPIMLDDYVLTEWRETQSTLAERVSRRVVGDFRDDKEFDRALSRLLAALKKR